MVAPQPTRELWDKIVAEIAFVKRTCEELKRDCCTTARYCMFDDLIQYTLLVEEDVRSGGPHALLPETQRKVARIGTVLGKLAITCCAANRLPLYTKCVEKLRWILFASFLFSRDTSGHDYFPDTGDI